MLAKGEDVRIASYLITFQITSPPFHSFPVIYSAIGWKESSRLLCKSKKQHMIAKSKKFLQLNFMGWKSPCCAVS